MAAIKFRARMSAGPSRLIWSVCVTTTAALTVMMLLAWLSDANSKREIEAVTLPEAMTAREDHREYDLVVNVTREGIIRVRGKTCTVERLYTLLARARVRRAASEDREPLVKIRCDAATPYAHWLAVMESCQRAGIYEVSFGVAQKHRDYALPPEAQLEESNTYELEKEG